MQEPLSSAEGPAFSLLLYQENPGTVSVLGLGIPRGLQGWGVKPCSKEINTVCQYCKNTVPAVPHHAEPQHIVPDHRDTDTFSLINTISIVAISSLVLIKCAVFLCVYQNKFQVNKKKKTVMGLVTYSMYWLLCFTLMGIELHMRWPSSHQGCGPTKSCFQALQPLSTVQ